MRLTSSLSLALALPLASLLLLPACGGSSSKQDGDSDGVGGGKDNCPDVANPGQEDADGDGFGDACDDTPNMPTTSAGATATATATATETDTDPTSDSSPTTGSSDSSPTSGASDTAPTSGGSDTSPTSGVTDTATGGTSEGSGSGGTDSDTGGGATSVAQCLKACRMDTDCGDAPCVNGICDFGCVDDAQCATEYGDPQYKCIPLNGRKECRIGCETDDMCSELLYVCGNKGDDDRKFCADPCRSDTDCEGGGNVADGGDKCINGVCGCTMDSDCAWTDHPYCGT